MNNMRQLLLIYNPVAGSAKFKNKLDWIIDEFQERNIIIIPYRTRGAGRDNLEQLIKHTEFDGILVAGGDGSLHQVINAIMISGIKKPVGILGSGTSNDFATHLGLDKNVDNYFDRIANNITRKIDIGKINEKFFFNVASAGVLTGIAHEVTPTLKNLLGKLAYYAKSIEEIPKLKSFSLNICADTVEYELESFLFVIANSPVVAGMLCIGDDIVIDDGKLDLLAIKKSSLSQFFTTATDLFAGKGITNRENVVHIKAKTFDIMANVDLLSDLDGEIGSKLPLHIETMPNAIDFYV